MNTLNALKNFLSLKRLNPSASRQICIFTQYPVLQRNLNSISIKEACRKVKIKLYEKNYLSSLDRIEIFDRETEEAVKKFQEDNSLVVDGAVGPLTYACLFYPKLYRKNKISSREVSEAILLLQSILTREGFCISDQESVFGKSTERAVRLFQKRYGLNSDGIVGAVTWAVLLGMRQSAEKFSTPMFIFKMHYDFFESGFMVILVLIGMYFSPLKSIDKISLQSIIISYCLVFLVPIFLNKLSIQNIIETSGLFKYSPYVIIGFCWNTVFEFILKMIQMPVK